MNEAIQGLSPAPFVCKTDESAGDNVSFFWQGSAQSCIKMFTFAFVPWPSDRRRNAITGKQINISLSNGGRWLVHPGRGWANPSDLCEIDALTTAARFESSDKTSDIENSFDVDRPQLCRWTSTHAWNESHASLCRRREEKHSLILISVKWMLYSSLSWPSQVVPLCQSKALRPSPSRLLSASQSA